MTKKKTYTEAIQEIEEIIESVESGDLDVDKLSEKVKEVAALLTFCKDKLHNTEEEVQKILDSIQGDD